MAADLEFFVNPEAVKDACKLLGIGEYENSGYRGNAGFATELERKWDIKTWRAACKKAMSLCRNLQALYFKELDAREEAGMPRYPEDPEGQFWIDFG